MGEVLILRTVALVMSSAAVSVPAASQSSDSVTVIYGTLGGGVSSPPSSSYKQGVSFVASLDVVPPRFAFNARLDLSTTSLSPKAGGANGELMAVSIVGLFPLAGSKVEPEIWAFAGPSYARAQVYSSSSQQLPSSPWAGGLVAGGGIQISSNFGLEIRAHTVSGVTWIPFTLSFRL